MKVMAGGRYKVVGVSSHKPARPWRTAFRLTISILLAALVSIHASTFVLWRANKLGRTCMSDVPDHLSALPTGTRIAMVSLSDEGHRKRTSPTGRKMSRSRSRSFRGLNEMVESNKKAYARKWGYDYMNAWRSIDQSRPTSWSKIPAIRSHLDSYDWVFWNDADSLVTNPEISLERVLQSAVQSSGGYPDLVVTEDVNGVNAGLFFVRKTRWSEEFLDRWWNMTSFITRGSTRSGDNAALIHLIDDYYTASNHGQHVHVAPMQCLFNSYPWIPTPKSFYRLFLSPSSFWKGVYSGGDFMVHLAGLDDKAEWAAKILRGLQVPMSSSSSSSFVGLKLF